MLLLTLVLLFIVNLGWLYTYFASHYSKALINQFLWSWLEINFEPSSYIAVVLLISVTAQLCMIVVVYGYAKRGQYVRKRAVKIQSENKELKSATKSHEKMLLEQSNNLAAASGIEQKNEVLTAQVAALNTTLHSTQQELEALQLEYDLLRHSSPTKAEHSTFKLPEALSNVLKKIQSKYKKDL